MIYFIVTNPIYQITYNINPMTSLTYDLSDIFNETGYINKNDCYKYNNNRIITHIILTQSNDSPIKIGNDFLWNYTKLISIDVSKIINVIAIGNDFLLGCTKLINFDTTGLTSLITIGNHFLSHCYKLINFDATGLTSLTTIGNSFLFECHSLVHFNTIGIISLATISDYFLYRCNKNLTITIKNPSNCLHNELLKTTYTITQLYNIPVIHLDNNCVI